jgi:hypothetical protein
MRTNVSFLLLALPISMGQSMAVAQEDLECSSKSFETVYEWVGEGLTKREATWYFENWFSGSRDGFFAEDCLPACGPDCKASLDVSPKGMRRISMRLSKGIPEWEVAQDMTAICTCSELEKNISTADKDVVR